LAQNVTSASEMPSPQFEYGCLGGTGGFDYTRSGAIRRPAAQGRRSPLKGWRDLLRRLRGRLLRRKAAVEGFALGGHLFEKLRRREARAVFGLELAAELDEVFRPHEVDIGQRAASERRKAESEDRADVGLARVDDDVILDRARGFHGLHHEEALLELLDIERIGVEMLRLQRRNAGPQALLAL